VNNINSGITAEYVDKWVGLIDECLEQDSYGEQEACSLCPPKMGSISSRVCMDEWDCVCYRWKGMCCANILKEACTKSSRESRNEWLARKWLPENVRPVLIELRAWIISQKPSQGTIIKNLV
jgi:hypothetical protein